jgi:hypothetical protein
MVLPDQVTPALLEFFRVHTSGFICVGMEGARLDALQLPLMVRLPASAGTRCCMPQLPLHALRAPPASYMHAWCMKRAEPARDKRNARQVGLGLRPGMQALGRAAGLCCGC